MSQEDQPQPAEAIASPVVQAPPAAPAPAFEPNMVRLPRRRPVLGPSLWVFGVLLWSFMVFGQYTTSWLPGSAPLAEGAAVFFVLAATTVAWVLAVRRSLAVRSAGQQAVAARAINIGVSAFALWLATVFVAFVIGRASGTNLDVLITSVLLLASCVAVIQGRRMTLPVGEVRAPSTPRERVVGMLLWAGAVAMTLGACGELVGSN